MPFYLDVRYINFGSRYRFIDTFTVKPNCEDFTNELSAQEKK